MPGITPRFPISEEEIARVVHEFYSVIRAHPTLGPIFCRHISDWGAYEAKVIEFWQSAILLEKNHTSHPMQLHRDSGDVKPAHFDEWLDIFDTVLGRHLSPISAHAWSILARRIGRGMRHGVEELQSAVRAQTMARPIY